jgi:hypothetical protein
MTNETQNPEITKLALEQLIKETKWNIEYHTKKIAEQQVLLQIYTNQLNQLNQLN